MKESLHHKAATDLGQMTEPHGAVFACPDGLLTTVGVFP